jgi:hypothetical protein
MSKTLRVSSFRRLPKATHGRLRSRSLLEPEHRDTAPRVSIGEPFNPYREIWGFDPLTWFGANTDLTE